MLRIGLGKIQLMSPAGKGVNRYKRKPPNDPRSIKKTQDTHVFLCLLFKFKEHNVPVKDEPAV